jgi:hypothetical protein
MSIKAWEVVVEIINNKMVPDIMIWCGERPIKHNNGSRAQRRRAMPGKYRDNIRLFDFYNNIVKNILYKYCKI